jgi:hypothetical protein
MHALIVTANRKRTKNITVHIQNKRSYTHTSIYTVANRNARNYVHTPKTYT